LPKQSVDPQRQAADEQPEENGGREMSQLLPRRRLMKVLF
jgi:hypothetical protein